jgi:hypothetical protein
MKLALTLSQALRKAVSGGTRVSGRPCQVPQDIFLLVLIGLSPGQAPVSAKNTQDILG